MNSNAIMWYGGDNGYVLFYGNIFTMINLKNGLAAARNGATDNEQLPNSVLYTIDPQINTML